MRWMVSERNVALAIVILQGGTFPLRPDCAVLCQWDESFLSKAFRWQWLLLEVVTSDSDRTLSFLTPETYGFRGLSEDSISEVTIDLQSNTFRLRPASAIPYHRDASFLSTVRRNHLSDNHWSSRWNCRPPTTSCRLLPSRYSVSQCSSKTRSQRRPWFVEVVP